MFGHVWTCSVSHVLGLTVCLVQSSYLRERRHCGGPCFSRITAFSGLFRLLPPSIPDEREVASDTFIHSPSFVLYSDHYTRIRKAAETRKLRAWLAKSSGKIPQAATFALAMHLANNLH